MWFTPRCCTHSRSKACCVVQVQRNKHGGFPSESSNLFGPHPTSRQCSPDLRPRRKSPAPHYSFQSFNLNKQQLLGIHTTSVPRWVMMVAGKLTLLSSGNSTDQVDSIPKRRELVKEGAKDPSTTQTKELQNEQQEHFWKYCALSHRPLAVPVVSDWMGKLYNKDAVLESLIANSGDRSQEKSEDLQFESLKDVVEVKFQAEEQGDDRKTSSSSRWMCPITNKNLGPGVKAVYLVPCGHAFSESAVKEISGDVCLQVCVLIFG